MDFCVSYDWPGNVRELKHCIERMAAMYSEGTRAADLPSALVNFRDAGSLQSFAGAVAEEPEETMWVAPKSPVISIPQSEKQTIEAALAAARRREARCGGDAPDRAHHAVSKNETIRH